MDNQDTHLAELEARIDAGETFEAQRKAGKIAVNIGIHVAVPDHAVKHRKNGLPVSRFLPLQSGGTVVNDGGRKIKVHANGLRTDMRGRVIVAGKRDVETLKALGYERE